MESILVVDDEPNLRELLQLVLTDEGYAATSARDGVEALAVLERQPVDLVITDLIMPRLNGVELIRALRAGETCPEVPVILLSALHEPNVAGMGRVAFMAKPFALGPLLSEVERAVAPGDPSGTVASAG